MGIMQEEITWASCFIFSSGVGRGSALLQLVCLSSVEGILCIGFFGLCPNMTSVSSSSGGWDCKWIHSKSVSTIQAREATVETKQAHSSAISYRLQWQAALSKSQYRLKSHTVHRREIPRASFWTHRSAGCPWGPAPCTHLFEVRHRKAQCLKKEPSVLQETICISFLQTMDTSRKQVTEIQWKVAGVSSARVRRTLAKGDGLPPEEIQSVV